MSAKSKSKTQIKIPHTLAEAVRAGNAVAILGAGASMECRHAHGTQRVPNAMQLRDHLAKKFLGTTNEERDLATVAEMAIVAGAGLPLVFAQPLNFRGITPPLS